MLDEYSLFCKKNSYTSRFYTLRGQPHQNKNNCIVMLKKILLLTTAAVFVASAVNAQLTFGLKAGMNMSGMTEYENSKIKLGYKIGPTMEYLLNDNIAIQTGLFLSSKGAKSEEIEYEDELTGLKIKAEETTDANYLELPISLAYIYPVSQKINIYAHAGPYFAYGIFGKTKIKASASILSTTIEMNTFSESNVEIADQKIEVDALLKRFDAGLVFGVGVEINRFTIGANYDLGLTNVINKNANIFNQSEINMEVPESKNRNFWISVGYLF